MRAIPGDQRFEGEARFDIGDLVRYKGTELVIGGLAKGSDGRFVYMMRPVGSRRQVFAWEGDLARPG